MPADIDVVILDEHHFAEESLSRVRNLAMYCKSFLPLAGAVVRMGFAGENKLNRHLRIVDQCRDAFDILKNAALRVYRW